MDLWSLIKIVSIVTYVGGEELVKERSFQKYNTRDPPIFTTRAGN